ncbi:Putative S-adenosyl-L-methionine-dependent methyltransferase [Frankliniella fusca]|uniref:S-adenosyl-L-methionine-dependent methyltransferase n=1 Tax=Frankliniella fusca TaxID=407009 RepID=A0AAE1HI11_9NEOP|nr:Putative S-adenosyl-L-methionine-dependent methyltransferase [Frankliniella fusca]
MLHARQAFSVKQVYQENFVEVLRILNIHPPRCREGFVNLLQTSHPLRLEVASSRVGSSPAPHHGQQQHRSPTAACLSARCEAGRTSVFALQGCSPLLQGVGQVKRELSRILEEVGALGAADHIAVLLDDWCSYMGGFGLLQPDPGLENIWRHEGHKHRSLTFPFAFFAIPRR